MRALIAVLALLTVAVQYRVWVGDQSLADVWRLERSVAGQVAENDRLAARNARLSAEVHDLRDGLDTVERRAREELGMIHRDETLYQFSGR